MRVERGPGAGPPRRQPGAAARSRSPRPSLAAAERRVPETEARLAEARLRQERAADLRRQGVSAAGRARRRRRRGRRRSRRSSRRCAAQVEVSRARGGAGAPEPRGHRDPRALRGRRDLEERPARRDDLADVGGGGFTRTGISTIVDMTSLEVEVDVNEAYIQRVAPGPEGRRDARRLSGWPIPAHVITTIPAADREKATVKVRIGFDAARRPHPAGHGREGRLPGRARAAAPARRSVRVARSALRGAARRGVRLGRRGRTARAARGAARARRLRPGRDRRRPRRRRARGGRGPGERSTPSSRIVERGQD